MKRIMITTLFLTISAAGFSQYKTAVGIRFNGGYGVSIKHNRNSRAALEGIISGYRNGVNAALLYEIHNANRDSPGFRWYYGVGGHFGAWGDYPHERHPWWYDETRAGVSVGVDGIVGIEYTFSEIPLNLSLDWKPVFNIVQRPGVFVGDVGLTVRLPFR
jgi:hypothetical protein